MCTVGFNALDFFLYIFHKLMTLKKIKEVNQCMENSLYILMRCVKLQR